MPSLTRKVIKGRSYYDLRHCQRMDGRPKIVKTTYLGSTEQVLARLATPALRPQPRAVEIATLGNVAALYDVAHQLDLVALIDAHLPKREQGLSVGQYLLLATLNRAAHPTSKAGLADWYQRTVLPRLVPASPGQLSSQAFWNHMERVTQGCAHITLIFDKGNNSHEAFENLDGSGFHFVGSLVSTQHPDLLAIPQRRFRPLQDARLEECRTYRTTKVVFGVERTVLVTHNENLLVGQLQGIAANLTKARGKLRALQQQLQRWQQGRVRGGRRPTRAGVLRQIEAALSAQFMSRLITYELSADPVPTLTFRTDASAFDALRRTVLGKTILFTDNADWSDEQIVLGYRAQSHIERAFRDMKNPHFLGWSPMFHWTDSKIRVHAFYCVLALLLSSLLQRTLHQKGHALSLQRMFELLGGIQETTVLFEPAPGERRPGTATCLSALTAEQHAIMTALDLARYQRH